jgi:PAS domain-containing protein
VGLCLFRRDGTLLTANRPFAQMLGYDSPAELLAVAGVLGVFASPEEQSRIFGSVKSSENRCSDVRFRRKDGCRRDHRTLAAEGGEGAVALAVFDPNDHHPPFLLPPA